MKGKVAIEWFSAWLNSWSGHSQTAVEMGKKLKSAVNVIDLYCLFRALSAVCRLHLFQEHQHHRSFPTTQCYSRSGYNLPIIMKCSDVWHYRVDALIHPQHMLPHYSRRYMRCCCFSNVKSIRVIFSPLPPAVHKSKKEAIWKRRWV